MAPIPIAEPQRPAGGRGVALLAGGFRPFFLLAAWGAALALPVWLAGWTGHLAFEPPLGLVRWHGHEMIFGVATAGLAGFLLTAVPNWTGAAPVAGVRLALLAALWLAGRAGLAGALPTPVAAAIDAAFLPALALAVGPAILRRSGARNGPLVLVLLVLAAVNAAFHTDLVAFDAGAALRLAVGIFAILIAVIGGRIVPAFTQSGFAAAGRSVAILPAPRLDRLAIAAMVLTVLLDAAGAPGILVAGLAAVSAALHAVRLARWHGWRAPGLPLVWVLHAGYLWLPVGAALLAMERIGAIAGTAALHAWGAGAVGTMLIAVMSRASLGHGGRPLAANATTSIAYLLVFGGAAARVAGALVDGPAQPALLLAGGIAWSLGYLAFAIRFLPIWLRPRADGRPG